MRYSRKTIFNMSAVRCFEFAKICILYFVSVQPWKQNLHLCTKFHRNWINCGWDIAIKPFSKWRPSAILNFRNLVFWSRALCQNVIPLLSAKFCINQTITCCQTIFNMAAVRHIGFAVTSSCCVWVLYTVFLTLCWIFISIGLVHSYILELLCFIILAGNCLFGAKFLGFGG